MADVSQQTDDEIFASIGVNNVASVSDDELFALIPSAAPSVSEQNQNALMNVVTADTPDPEAQALVGEEEQQRNQAIEIARSRGLPVDNWVDNPITFGETGDFLSWSQILPGGGLVQGKEALDLLGTSNRMLANKPVTPSERDFLNDTVDKHLEMQIRGQTYGSQFRFFGSQMPAFMLEFALTMGPGKTAQVAATKASMNIAQNRALQAAVAGTTRVATQTALLMPTQGAREYGSIRMMGFEYTDKGQLVFAEAKETPAVSALRAFGYVSAETISELSGGVVRKALNKPFKSAIDKLPDNLKAGLIDAYKKLKPNATVEKIFTRAGWNGMLFELGEERVADVLRATTDFALVDEFTFDDVLDSIVPSKEQFLLEVGLITAAGSAKATASAGMNLLMRNGATQEEAEVVLENTTALEQEAMVDELLDQQQLFDSQADQRPDVMDQLLEEYDSMGQEAVDRSIELEEKEIVALEKKARGIRRRAQSLARRIANAGGINIDSVRDNVGFETEDLKWINKMSGVTVFRVNGGMAVDELKGNDVLVGLEGPTAETYEEMSRQTEGVVEAAIQSMLDNPKVSSDPDVQAEADLVEAEIEERLMLREFLADRPRPDDAPDIDISELERADREKVESILASRPEVSQAEFESSLDDLESYVASMQTAEATIDEDGQMETGPTEMSEKIYTSTFLGLPLGTTYYDLFDRVGAFIDLAKEASKRGREALGNRLQLAVSRYAAVGNMANQMLTRGTFVENADGSITVTGVGLKQILDDFNNLVSGVEPDAAKRREDLERYLEALRYWSDLTVRDDVMVTDEQKEAAIDTLYNYLPSKYGSAYSYFESIGKEIHAYQARVLKLLVDSGSMSQETYDKILRLNPNYVPFQKELDDEQFSDLEEMPPLFSGISMKRVVKRIQGSEIDNKSPLEAIAKNTTRIVDLAYQNNVSRMVGALAGIMPEYVRLLRVEPTVTTRGGKTTTTLEQPVNSIEVFVNGKRRFYKVSPILIEAMQRMKPEQVAFWERVLLSPVRLSAQVLRFGATVTPEFMARNLFKDVYGSVLGSKARPTPIDAVKGLFHALGKTELYDQWMRSGGSLNSYMDMSDQNIAKTYKELMQDDGRLMRLAKRLAPWNFGLELDSAVRIGTFIAAKRKGMSDAEAAYESRDVTIDFDRGGKVSKAMNRYVTFFNVGMQATDKLVRTVRDHPKMTLFLGMSTITMPSVLISGYYLFQADEEERNEYLEIPQWQKDMFWVYKQNGEWKRIPKPFSYGYIFGSVPERALLWAYGNNYEQGAEVFNDVLRGVSGAFSPVYDPWAILPTPVKIAIENATNHNFFRDRNIFPDWLEKMKPEKQVASYTSETAKAIGEVFDYSPAKIDNIIQGQFGGLGRYATDAGDQIINDFRRWNGESVPEDPVSSADIPLIKAFVMRFPAGSSSNSVQQYYEIADEFRATNDALDDLKGKERAQYKKDNKLILSMGRDVKRTTKRIRQLYKKRTKIYDSYVLSGEEKTRQLQILDQQMTLRARQFNEKFILRMNANK